MAVQVQCVCVCCTWPVHLSASIHQRGPLLHSNVAILQQLVKVGFVILWTVVCWAIQRVSDLHLLDLLHLRGRQWRNSSLLLLLKLWNCIMGSVGASVFLVLEPNSKFHHCFFNAFLMSPQLYGNTLKCRVCTILFLQEGGVSVWDSLTTRLMNSSCMDSSTNRRPAAMQFSPLLKYTELMPCEAAHTHTHKETQ